MCVSVCLTTLTSVPSLPLGAPACNPNACRASGRGLQPKGLRVKEVADLKVYTKGAGSGELNISVKGPSKTVNRHVAPAASSPSSFFFFCLQRA